MFSVYRITLTIWSDALMGSGRKARWNGNGEFVIYTAESRSLACLENVVHRTGEGLHQDFSVMEIAVPSGMKIANVTPGQLPENWQAFENYHLCRKIGSSWYNKAETAILRVPSAIIEGDHNYLINSRHPGSRKLKIKKVSPFIFDQRIKM